MALLTSVAEAWWLLINVEKMSSFPFLVYKNPLKATTPESVPVLP